MKKYIIKLMSASILITIPVLAAEHVKDSLENNPKPFFSDIIYKVQNLGHNNQQLNFLSYEDSNWGWIEGDTDANRTPDHKGFLVQIFPTSNGQYNIINACGTKQTLYTRLDVANHCRYFGTKKTLEAKSDGAKFKFESSDVPNYYKIINSNTGDRCLYLKDRNGSTTSVWGSTENWEGEENKEGFLFRFLPQHYKLHAVIDSQQCIGTPIKSFVSETKTGSGPYTSGSISPEPLKFTLDNTQTSTFNRSETNTISHTAGIEIQFGKSGGEKGGVEGGLKASYTFGSEFVKAIEEGKNSTFNEKYEYSHIIPPFTVPPGKKIKYEVVLQKYLENIPFTAAVKYTGQAKILPREISFEKFVDEPYQGVDDEHVFHFLTNEKITNAERMEDGRTVKACIKGNKQITSYEFINKFFQSDVDKENWETYYPS